MLLNYNHFINTKSIKLVLTQWEKTYWNWYNYFSSFNSSLKRHCDEN
ncbi:hypothetical protein [Colwellia sp.]